MKGFYINLDLTNSLVRLFPTSLLKCLIGVNFYGVELEIPVTPLEGLLDITKDLLYKVSF